MSRRAVAELDVSTSWGSFLVVGNPEGDYLASTYLRGERGHDALGGGSRSDADEMYFITGGEIIDAPAACYLTLDQALAAGHSFWVDHQRAPDLSWAVDPVAYDLPILE